jgi:hypothetical protein
MKRAALPRCGCCDENRAIYRKCYYCEEWCCYKCHPDDATACITCSRWCCDGCPREHSPRVPQYECDTCQRSLCPTCRAQCSSCRWYGDSCSCNQCWEMDSCDVCNDLCCHRCLPTCDFCTRDILNSTMWACAQVQTTHKILLSDAVIAHFTRKIKK